MIDESCRESGSVIAVEVLRNSAGSRPCRIDIISIPAIPYPDP